MSHKKNGSDRVQRAPVAAGSVGIEAPANSKAASTTPRARNWTQAEVFRAEFECLQQARRSQNGTQPGSEPTPRGQQNSVQTSADVGFVGLTLSGGGVRSGAVSLGFLTGLHESGLLEHVDYLSTVSGGGYAGALLTSENVNADGSQQPGAVDSVQSSRLFGPREGVSGESSSKQTRASLARLREMVAQCNYLIRHQNWMSRALLGVVAMGTVSISAMIFVTALLAYVFRMLYLPPVLEFLKVLGFEGDLIVPMTPAFAMFLVWLCCWLLSFFRHYRKATGHTAGYVFKGFLFCAILGATMIAVTGDVDVEQLLKRTGVSQDFWKQIAGIGGWVKSGIVALIIASLIPYFRPSALLNSGRERAAGPKKLLFLMARNGLLLGIPLIVFGILARENISAWNDERDDRLELKDLLTVPPLQALELGPELALFRSFDLTVADRSTNPSEELKLRRELVRRLYTDEIRLEWQRYIHALNKYEALNAGTSSESEGHQLSRLNSANERSRLERLTMLLAHLLLWEQPSPAASDFGKMRYWLQQSRDSQRRLMFLLNTQLLDPELSNITGVNSISPASVPGESTPDGTSSASSASGASEKQTNNSHSTALANALRMHVQLWTGHENVPFVDQCSAIVWFRDRLRKTRNLLQSPNSPTSSAIPPEKSKQAAITPSLELPAGILDVPPSMQSLFGFSVTEQSIPGKTLEETERFFSSLLKCNRAIVAAAFPGTIRPRDNSSEIFSSVVHTRDQQVRWSIVKWSFLVALLLSAICDLNSLSWHGFYAKQLGMFWIQTGSRGRQGLTLSDLSKNVTRPLHLMNAAVCLTGRSEVEDVGRGENPDHFLLSPLFCGSSHQGIGFVSTQNSLYGELQLADAVALSGAALSPWATNNALVRALLLVMNLRTGLWLPNPSQISGESSKRRSWDTIIDRHLFSPLRWLWLRFVPSGSWTLRPRDPESWSHLLVTDGGHYENLGIEALLQRRCALIIAVDASEDSNYEFQGLAIAMNRARTRDGIQFLDAHADRPCGFPDALMPDPASHFSEDRFFAIRVLYPATDVAGETEGVLLVVKSVMLQSDPFELQQHRKEFTAFPNDPTTDQFFSPDKFEAYRFLGFTAARAFANQLQFAEKKDQSSFIESVRKKFCSSIDLERLLGSLEMALRVYLDGEKSENSSGKIPEELLEILQKLSAPRPERSWKTNFRPLESEHFCSNLQKLQKNPAFLQYQELLQRLTEQLGKGIDHSAETKTGRSRTRRAPVH